MTDKTKVTNSEDAEKKKNENVILYIGDDHGYWESLKERFSESYKQLNLNFELFYEFHEESIQSLALQIIAERPKIVFFDLSQQTEEILHLARIMVRLNAMIKPIYVGLADLKQGKELIQAGTIAGLRNVHIKSSEQSSVIYNSILSAFPDSMETHGFATAKLNDEVIAYMPAKISVVSDAGIRVETNYVARAGETYSLHNFWKEKGILKTPQVVCASVSDEDLFYNFNYVQEYGFEYVLAFSATVDMAPEVVEQKNHEYEAQLEDCKQRMEAWVTNNQKHTRPKMLKALVIDKGLSFFNGQTPTDRFEFVLRCQPYLKNVKKEILRISPQLIVFNLETITVEEAEANEDIAYTYNDTRTLQYFIKTIKTIGNYNPFIIVFSAEGHDTNKLQKILNYKNIMANASDLTPELVLKMAKLLEGKLKDKIEDYDVPTVILDKKDAKTYCEFEYPITIVACSENDIYFNCEEELKVGTTLRLNLPASMYISVEVPPKHSKVQATCYGVLHGIGEEEKRSLRKFVNEVFFRAHEDKKEKEREQVESQKQKAVEKKLSQEKLEIEKLAQEKKDIETAKAEKAAQAAAANKKD